MSTPEMTVITLKKTPYFLSQNTGGLNWGENALYISTITV